MSDARDELVEILSRHDLYFTADWTPELCVDDAADAILAAGYTRPRTINTVAELDALPVGSVLIDRDGDVCQRFRGGWRAVIAERMGEPWLTDTLEVDLPATVLHTP